jgi:hypothetical protein
LQIIEGKSLLTFKAKYTTSKDDGNKLGDFLYLPLKFILIDLLSVDASMDEKRGELIDHKRIDNFKLWYIKKFATSYLV